MLPAKLKLEANKVTLTALYVGLDFGPKYDPDLKLWSAHVVANVTSKLNGSAR